MILGQIVRRIAVAGFSLLVLAVAVALGGARTSAHAALAYAPAPAAHPVIGDRQLGSPCFIAVGTCSIHPCVEFVGGAHSALLQSAAQTALVEVLPPRLSAQRCAPHPDRPLSAITMGSSPRPGDPYAQALARALAQGSGLLSHRGP